MWSSKHTHHHLDHYQYSLHNNQPLALAKCGLFIISANTSIHLNLGLIFSSVYSSVHQYLFSFQVTIQWFVLTLNGLKFVTSWPEKMRTGEIIWWCVVQCVTLMTTFPAGLWNTSLKRIKIDRMVKYNHVFWTEDRWMSKDFIEMYVLSSWWCSMSCTKSLVKIVCFIQYVGSWINNPILILSFLSDFNHPWPQSLHTPHISLGTLCQYRITPWVNKVLETFWYME